MQRTFVIAALVVGFTGSAFAESPLAGVHDAPFASGKTRAEVQAELAEFKRSGVNPWSASYNPLRNLRSAKTREAVAAEYLASREQVHAMTAEDSGSQYLRAATQPAPAGRFLAAQ